MLGHFVQFIANDSSPSSFAVEGSDLTADEQIIVARAAVLLFGVVSGPGDALALLRGLPMSPGQAARLWPAIEEHRALLEAGAVPPNTCRNIGPFAVEAA